jgi:hypothetical protein
MVVRVVTQVGSTIEAVEPLSANAAAAAAAQVGNKSEIEKRGVCLCVCVRTLTRVFLSAHFTERLG